jgi:hypothetical protein
VTPPTPPPPALSHASCVPCTAEYSANCKSPCVVASGDHAVDHFGQSPTMHTYRCCSCRTDPGQRTGRKLGPTRLQATLGHTHDVGIWRTRTCLMRVHAVTQALCGIQALSFNGLHRPHATHIDCLFNRKRKLERDRNLVWFEGSLVRGTSCVMLLGSISECTDMLAQTHSALTVFLPPPSLLRWRATSIAVLF